MQYKLIFAALASLAIAAPAPAPKPFEDSAPLVAREEQAEQSQKSQQAGQYYGYPYPYNGKPYPYNDYQYNNNWNRPNPVYSYTSGGVRYCYSVNYNNGQPYLC